MRSFDPHFVILLVAGCAQILGIHDRGGDDDNGPAGNHCANVADTCGPAGNESCCTTIGVPGGMFLRDGSAGYQATLSDYALDKYLVTVGRFREFVDAGYGNQMMPPSAGAGAHVKTPNSGWDATWKTALPPSTSLMKLYLTSSQCGSAFTWTDAPADHENRPINCVTWEEAFAFCIWDAGYLPTFAEWQYAAAHGHDQLKYPWGATAPDATYAVYMTTAPADVGSTPKGNGLFGHADLTANLSEWMLDWANYFLPVPCVDCAELGSGYNTRILAGGSYNGCAVELAVVSPRIGAGGGARPFWGFRCARPAN